MRLLDQVQTGKKPGPRRIMLYGVQGIGKSTFGSLAPDPILLQTEDGADDIDCPKFPLITTFDQAIAALSELYSETHSYRTVVVDTLDWLERLIWDEVCRLKCVSNIAEIGFGKGYDLAMSQWRMFLAGLASLRNEKGMMVILLAHAKIERFQNPETEGYDRYSPRLHKTAAAVVQEWCDEVLFATYRVYTKTVEEGFGRTVTKGIGNSSDRILRTTERPACMAKNRLGLPEEIPFAWHEFAKYLGGN